MATENVKRRGRILIGAYLTAREGTPGPAQALLRATQRAGQATDLAMRLRRHGELSWKEVEGFGSLCGLAAADLIEWVLDTLEAADMVDVRRSEDGVIGVEERVGVAAGVLEQSVELWEAQGPTDEERCAITAAEMIGSLPLPLSELKAALEAAGHPPRGHRRALEALRAIGLMRELPSPRLGEQVAFSPYVWGDEAVDAAEFLRALPVNEREALGRLTQVAVDQPGRPVAQGENPGLLEAARHSGLLDAVPVTSQGSGQRVFAFPPGLRGRSDAYGDAAHERKLFVAHILNGHYFAPPHLGRIRDPLVLVQALINRGQVGPATSIGKGYTLLEAKGIVTAVPSSGDQMSLRLVKRDVAEDSMELLAQALGQEVNGQSNDLEALWLPDSYSTPEEDRSTLRAPAGADQEIVTSTVEELRRHIRGEGF